MRGKTSDRLQRLEQIKGLLKSRDHVTVAELAVELRVSRRTLSRDLAILRDSDVPIESDRGRGGGLRLQSNWALGRMHLSPAEAVDLLLSLTIAEQMHSPLLLEHLAAIRRKVAAAFSESYQRNIRVLRRRILVGEPASPAVLAGFTAPQKHGLANISQAFFAMNCLDIDYRDRHGAVTKRRIQPQFLCLNLPVWYLLAWDELRQAPRFFRTDRIRSAAIRPEKFRLGDPRLYLAGHEEGLQAL